MEPRRSWTPWAPRATRHEPRARARTAPHYIDPTRPLATNDSDVSQLLNHSDVEQAVTGAVRRGLAGPGVVAGGPPLVGCAVLELSHPI